MKTAGQVRLERQGGVAWLRLSHPGKFNAMSRAMWLQLRAAAQQVQADPELRCVVIAGEDGHFCAGGDIAEYPSFRFDAQALEHFHEEEVWGGLQALLDCPLPLIAAIEGNCMGAGLEIASCCDLRLAASDARFGAPIARLGFPMAPREAALVGAAVGRATAAAMLLAAEVFGGEDLLARGFLARLHAPADLLKEAAALAERVAALAPQAARANKRQLRGEAVLSPYAYADSAEHREGITAFLEKRKPVF